MAEISEGRRKRAESHLRSIAENPARLKNFDIDWAVVKSQLQRLKSAFQKGDGTEFSEAFEMLRNRLPLPQNLRGGEIGPAPKDEASMPREVFELINHMVRTLHNQQTQTSDKEQENEPDK